MNTNIYAYDYMSIRRNNILVNLEKEHKMRIYKAVKYHAQKFGQLEPKFVDSKKFVPKPANIAFAEKIYGNWERDWKDKPFNEMVNLLRIYDDRIEEIEKDDFDRMAEIEINALTDDWNTNNLFQWNDPLNYKGLERTDYNIFLDLFFRDENGNFTLFYDTWLDKVEHKSSIDDKNGVVFTKAMLREVFGDYAKPFTTGKDMIVNDVYDNRLRSNDSIYAYSPVVEYIKGLEGKWDGKKRLDTIFIDYLKADDNELNRKITRYWMINAIRCLLRPCEVGFYHMLVLVGDTNCGKTHVTESLFTLNGNRYYTYNVAMSDNEQKIGAILASAWALGFTERTGITKDDNNRQKAFMDMLNTEISYMKKFQNEVTKYKPHNCVYVTTNDTKLLNDYTVSYNKRYWIIPCNITEKEFQESGNYDRIKENVEQIWAEALYYYLQDPDAKLLLNFEDVEELRKLQEEYNTIKKEEVIERLNVLLHQDFYVRYKGNSDKKHTEFENEADFLNQAMGKFRSLDETRPKQLANCFPLAWVNDYFKKTGSWDNRHKQIMNGVIGDLGWEKKVVRMFGGLVYCLYNPSIEEGKKNSDDEETEEFFSSDDKTCRE